MENNWISSKFFIKTSNPRTDFRGGGILSLKFLDYFIENKTKIFINFVNTDFLMLGILIINATVKFLIKFIMKIFLGLFDSEGFSVEELIQTSKSNKSQICSRKQLKRFAKICIIQPNLLLKLIEIYIEEVGKIYQKEMKPNDKERNILLIDPILSMIFLILSKASLSSLAL